MIPSEESEAKIWAEKAQIPFDQIKRIMEMRSLLKEASTYTLKVEKLVRNPTKIIRLTN